MFIVTLFCFPIFCYQKVLFSLEKKMGPVKLVSSSKSGKNTKAHTLVLSKLWMESHFYHFMCMLRLHLAKT